MSERHDWCVAGFRIAGQSESPRDDIADALTSSEAIIAERRRTLLVR